MESDCLGTVLKIDAGVVAAFRQWFPALFALPLCLLWLYEWYCSHNSLSTAILHIVFSEILHTEGMGAITE